jgi:hypothetical protein
MKICTALISKPQNEQNEYTFAFISIYSYTFFFLSMYSYIAIMTKPQNQQNEYTFAFISIYSYTKHKTNRVWL